jgi:cystine transport system ATP-binding protein
MVIVTHEMSFARDVADRAIFMDQDALLNRRGKARCSPRLSSRVPQFLEKFLMQ